VIASCHSFSIYSSYFQMTSSSLQHASATKLIVPISQQDMLCKAGCGFYGNPQWHHLCSKCWREQHCIRAPAPMETSTNQQQHQFLSPKDLISPSRSSPKLSFDRFLEKKSQQVGRKSSTLRSILKKSPSSGIHIVPTNDVLKISEKKFKIVENNNSHHQQIPLSPCHGPASRQNDSSATKAYERTRRFWASSRNYRRLLTSIC